METVFQGLLVAGFLILLVVLLRAFFKGGDRMTKEANKTQWWKF